MKKEHKYAVIGGQYYYHCYGTTATLLGAKRLARQNQEYWDNWAGWHTPMVYDIADTEYHNGDRYPADGNTAPVAYFADGEWHEN